MNLNSQNILAYLIGPQRKYNLLAIIRLKMVYLMILFMENLADALSIVEDYLLLSDIGLKLLQIKVITKHIYYIAINIK